jgi:putative heme iron utilization protein
MATDFELDAARLFLTRRWAALATIEDGAPLATMVAYAPEARLDGLLMLLSELAQHTRNLLADPRVSLVVSDPDGGDGDPQLLPRATLVGEARPIARDTAEFAAARTLYLSSFPDAEMRFELADFHLFRLAPSAVRYVGGFARAASIVPAKLSQAAAERVTRA